VNHGQSQDRFVLLNQGDGTFTQPAVTAQATNASWIAAADFNHDGKADLAIAEYTTDPNSHAGLVQILISNGDGTFAVGNSYSSLGDRGLSGGTITMGDVNGDGNLDLVLGNVCDQHSNNVNYVYDDPIVNEARSGYCSGMAMAHSSQQPAFRPIPQSCPTVISGRSLSPM
jgi:hypothetical protein